MKKFKRYLMAVLLSILIMCCLLMTMFIGIWALDVHSFWSLTIGFVCVALTSYILTRYF